MGRVKRTNINSSCNNAMTPASRTPEGESNLCPICGHESRLEPSRPPGDAPCPYCGHLLWYSSERPESPLVQQTIDEALNRVGSSERPTLSSFNQTMEVFRAWTQQIAQVSDDRYFEELIVGLAGFMAARGGAVWLPTKKGLMLKYRHTDAAFPESPSDEQRRRALLRQVAADSQASLSAPPVSLRTDENVLLAAPVKKKWRIRAIVEIVQGPGASVDVQQRNLRALEYICEFACDRICELATAAAPLEAVAVAVPAGAAGKKRWWEVWKK